jgi:hypothetical protein
VKVIALTWVGDQAESSILDDLAAVDAVRIGGGELHFIARGRTAWEGAILRTGPESAGHDFITFGYDLPVVPRSMEMGTTRSPWRYDAATRHARRQSGLVS